MVRVRFVQLMASPTRTAQIGQELDLPAAEAEQRIRARQCVPVDGPPTAARAAAQEPEGNDPGAGDRGAGAGSEGEDLEAMKVPELRTLAETRGVDLGAATRKADIVDALRAAERERQDVDPDAPENPEHPGVRGDQGNGG